LAKKFFHVFGFVFPHEAVFLFGVDEVDEVGFLILAEGVEAFEGIDEVGFVHGGSRVVRRSGGSSREAKPQIK